MKIAMIGQKGIPARAGGIERHVEELSAELVKWGHDVLVFCRSWYVWPVRDHRGTRCIVIPSIRTKHLDTITHTFISILRAVWEKADVFHFHGVGPALLCWLPRLLRPSAKVVVTFHCIDRHHQKWNMFARLMLHIGERLACHVPDTTIAVSKTLSAYCHLSYGSETVYIPNGTHIPLEPSDMKHVKALGLTEGKYLMMCARLVKHKGAHKLMEAWKQLGVERPELMKDLRLAIVGGSAFTDGYVRELQEIAKADKTIVMTGLQVGEPLHALYAGSYAVIHPSESEGLPISVLEAMSYGKCVLASDIPENSELTGEQGIQFKAGDINDLKEKIAMLIEHPEQVEAVGRDARAFVARHFDWHDIGEQTSYLYEALHFIPDLKEAKFKV